MVRLRLGMILAAVGVVLVIVGALWMTVIFPPMEKLPADYERTTTFDGNYILGGTTIPVVLKRLHNANGVVDGTLLINEDIVVVNGVTGEPIPQFPDRSELLAVDRRTREYVDGGNIPREGQWSPPGHLEDGEDFLLWNPSAGKALEARYMGSEHFRGLKVLRYTINETHLPTPDPSFEAVDILINLWVEPESGTTVEQNSRTTYYALSSAMLAMPEDYQSTVSLEGIFTRLGTPTSVDVTMTQTATGTADGALIIDEHRTVLDAHTGDPLPDYDTSYTWAVDRVTRQNVDVSADYPDIPVREGQWSPPFQLKEGEDFSLWDRSAQAALTARYAGKEEFRGLTVFRYTIDEKGLPSPQPPTQAVDVLINLWIEPQSGIAVRQDSKVSYYVGPMAAFVSELQFTEETEDALVATAKEAAAVFGAPGSNASMGEVPVFTSDIAFADETVDDLVGIARDARDGLRWFGSYVPWIVICLGAVLAVVSGAVMLRSAIEKH